MSFFPALVLRTPGLLALLRMFRTGSSSTALEMFWTGSSGGPRTAAPTGLRGYRRKPDVTHAIVSRPEEAGTPLPLAVVPLLTSAWHDVVVLPFFGFYGAVSPPPC